MKRLLFISFILLMFVGCQQDPNRATNTSNTTTPTAEAATTGTATAVPAPTRETGVTILADGQLVAVNPPLALSFNASGQLAELHVKAGDSVRAGDIIATINDQALQDAVDNARAALLVSQAQLAQQQAGPSDAEIAQAQAQVAQAEGQVAQAEAGLTASQATRSSLWNTSNTADIMDAEANVATTFREYESLRRTHEQMILNEILGDQEEEMRYQVDAARTTYEAAQARLDQLQAGPTTSSIQSADADIAQATANIGQSEASVASAQAQLDILLAGASAEEIAVTTAQIAQAELSLAQAERALADAQLIAPWAGTVLSLDVAPGAFVGPGTPIITLQDIQQLEFHTTNLSERDLNQIDRGQSARIILKTYPDTPIEGSIIRIAPQAGEMVGDAATFAIVIQLMETSLELRPGMTGRAEIFRVEG